MIVHLVKLCVGIDDVAELEASVQRRSAEAAARGEPPIVRHVTRHRPRRADEILGGGSLYWVIRGEIRVRQSVRLLEPATAFDGSARCAIGLEPRLVATRPVPRRPFQGWRYLDAADAPADLDATGAHDLPEGLRRELAALGLL